MKTISPDRNIDETYLVRKYSLSRQQAHRLLGTFGHRKSDVERLLGAKGRTQIHRREEMDQSTAEVAFR